MTTNTCRPLTTLLLSGILVFAGAPALQGQAGSVADQDGWEVPRTPDGRPDLQGNWTNATVTPFERPAGQGPTMSWEEVAQIEQRAELQAIAATRPSDPNRPPPPAGGIGPQTGAAGGTGGYNSVYIDRGDRVAVVRGEPRTSLVTNPPNGRVPGLTPEAQAWRAERQQFNRQFGSYDNPENRPIGERCIMSFGSNAGPPMLPNGFYNNNYTIVQTADHVVIMTEMIHDARIIRIGDGPRLPDHVRPWMGDSRGHWEGDTLVIETTNFHPDQLFRGNPSDNLRVIERLTRVDEETILYEFTVDDPSVYTETWGGEVPFLSMGDELLYEYACHEGNYALFNILSGARYEEQQAAEAAGSTLPEE
jgi:hypothetical protein